MVDTRQQEPEEDIELTGEDNLDEPDLEVEELQHKDKLKVLQQKLRACEAAKADHLEQLQRAKAEFLNSKKRITEERERDHERSTEEFVLRILPLCDSFQMAMSDQAVWEQVDASWRTGIEAINSQLQSILKQYDVNRIDPVGEHFDHHKHEAVGSEDSEQESDTITKVLQHGYERNGLIIRTAKVILSN